MIRYALVYTFLGLVMTALVYIVGMPWVSERRKAAWSARRRSRQPRRAN
jgi:hypothetical protein